MAQALLAIYLAKKGAKITAFDSNKEMLNIAKREARKNKVKIKFISKKATNFSFSGKFDIIISSSVMFHIANLKKVIENIGNCSKAGTKILIVNPYNTIYPSTKKIPRKKYKAKLTVGYTTDVYYHSLAEYKSLFSENGFKLIKSNNMLLKKTHLNAKESFKLVSKKYLGKPIASLLVFKKQ